MDRRQCDEKNVLPAFYHGNDSDAWRMSSGRDRRGGKETGDLYGGRTGELPEEAETIVEEKKAGKFQMTYQSGNDLYLIRGYGKQMSGGYSIQVKELSESSTAVFFETKLIGPAPEEQSGEPSYPYIAVENKVPG